MSFIGDRLEIPNVAIIITTGYSRGEQLMTVDEAIKLKNHGTKIFLIEIGKRFHKIEMNAIASDSAQWLFTFDYLKSIRINLTESVCETGLGLYEPAL